MKILPLDNDLLMLKVGKLIFQQVFERLTPVLDSKQKIILVKQTNFPQ